VVRKTRRLDCSQPLLRKVLQEVMWNNREILPEHLNYVRGMQMVRKRDWKRSTEWDNILGYYEPQDGYLKFHEALLKGPEERLIEDLLIALGEAVLGDYASRKAVREIHSAGHVLGKVFEVELRPPQERRSFLGDPELRTYLELAQLRPRRENSNLYCLLVNGNEAFTPPGLLFGLFYAWYVNNRFGGIMDYEISLLRWKISELIPKPSMERGRLQKRVDFFRRHVFRQEIPPTIEELG
jgi:hypothetical protein